MRQVTVYKTAPNAPVISKAVNVLVPPLRILSDLSPMNVLSVGSSILDVLDSSDVRSQHENFWFVFSKEMFAQGSVIYLSEVKGHVISLPSKDIPTMIRIMRSPRGAEITLRNLLLQYQDAHYI